jgi:hypothetical protein
MSGKRRASAIRMMMVAGGLVAAVPALGASDEPGALVCNGKPQRGARTGLLCDGKPQNGARTGLLCNGKPQKGAHAGLVCNSKPQIGARAGLLCNGKPQNATTLTVAQPAKTTPQ